MLYELVVVCCLCVVWRLWRARGACAEPPELSGRLPIIGHAHKIMGDGAHMYKAVQKISEECLQKGGVITINLGPRKIYCVADPEDCVTIANTCLKKHPFFEFGKGLFGNGLVTADVPTWKRNRKLLNPAFNQHVLDGYIEIFNSKSQEVVEQFANELGKPMDHENILRKNNLETICLTAFGIDASKYADSQNYLPRLTSYIKIINERIQKFWLHSDFIFNLTSQKKILEEDLEYMLALSKSIIKKKKLERQNAGHKTGNIKTFIDLLLDLSEETGCFTDEQIREETDNVIAGGHDTTATLLTFALTILGSRIDIQNKAYEEIQHVLGDSKKYIDKDDLSKLVYIEAIIKETLRLYTVLPVIIRCIDTDVKLKNYTIKADSECFFLNYGLLRHAIWGPDADQFRPERWLEKETLPDPKYFGAFGLGRRACIGKTYAMMSMKITLAHVVQTYSISSDMSKMVIQMHLMPRPESGHHITLALRNKSV